LSKKAFSLIELLIVILIIGVFYSLAINSFDNLNKNNKKLTLENLKKYMKSLEYTNSVKLLCLDDCSSCDFYVDNNKTKRIENFLDSTVVSYKYDFFYGYVELQKEVYINSQNIEEDVCFSYELDKNGVGDQVLIEFNNKFYDFSSYFGNTPVYDSIQSASEAKESLTSEVMR